MHSVSTAAGSTRLNGVNALDDCDILSLFFSLKSSVGSLGACAVDLTRMAMLTARQTEQRGTSVPVQHLVL